MTFPSGFDTHTAVKFLFRRASAHHSVVSLASMRTADYVDTALAIASAMGEARAVTAEERAYDMLSEFHRLVPWAGIELAAWDEATSRHRTLVQIGYPGAVIDHLNGRMFVEDICWPELHRDPRTLSWKDMEFDLATSRFYTEVLVPNGLVEGMYTPLFSSDGRYRGMLTLNTDSWTFPTADAKSVTDRLVPALSGLVERLTGAAPAEACAGVENVAVVDVGLRFSHELRTGVPVPGFVEDAVCGALQSGDRLGRFLVWPAGEVDPTHVVLSAGSAAADTVLVVWRVAPAPHGLTRRQLDVIAGIADGLSNQEIARRLSVSPRTVTTHVENILVRLGLASRSAVVRTALSHGMYLMSGMPEQRQ